MVLYRVPSLCPTQITSEVPGCTAIALIADSVSGLMDRQDGAIEVRTSSLRHNDCPPASMRPCALGSRMNGAMKFDLPFASGRFFQSPIAVTPSVQRKMDKY